MSTDTTPEDHTKTDEQSLNSGDVLVNRYRAERCLASGGYGDVWFSTDLETNHPVAIKILRNDAGNHDPAALARMRFEAEILQSIHHPNIVEVHGYFSAPIGNFIVMEYLDGSPLDVVIKARGSSEHETVVAAVEQLLNALAASHERGIVHRDIKPENIVLIPDGRGGEIAKLVDFGIAKASELLSENEDGVTLVQTRAGGFMGTPRYAAPEQVVGDPFTESIDLFALGLVIAEWLTGKMRLGHESHGEVMATLLAVEPIDMSDCPYRWREWLGLMTAKNPDERYQSATEARSKFFELVIKLHERADFLETDDAQTPQPESDEPRLDEGPLVVDFDRARQVPNRPTFVSSAPQKELPPLESFVEQREAQREAQRHAEERDDEEPSNPIVVISAFLFVALFVLVGMMILL